MKFAQIFLFINLTQLIFVASASTSVLASEDLNLYREALLQQTLQPDKACASFQVLAQKENFLLKDLAWARQGLICETLDLPPLPPQSDDHYASDLLLAARLRLAQKRGELQNATELWIKKARKNISQKNFLSELENLQQWLAKSTSAPEETSILQSLILKAKTDRAPRSIEKPTEAQWLLVAQDFLNARDFNQARKFAQLTLNRKNLSEDDRASAFRILRNSFKLEQKVEKYLSALAEEFSYYRRKKQIAKASEIGLLYARALWTAGQNSKSKQILTSLEKLYPAGNKPNEIFFIRGKMAEEQKDYLAAHSYFSNGSLDLKSPLGKKLQFAKAWASWKLKNGEQLVADLLPLATLPEEEAFEVSRAHYWLSRAYGLQKNEAKRIETLEKLLSLDPLGFYGVAARYELGLPLVQYKIPNEPVRFVSSPLYNTELYRALDLVGEVEVLKSLAERDLNRLSPTTTPQDALPLLTAASRAQVYLPLFSKISLLPPQIRADLLKQDPRVLFPMDFLPLIKEQSLSQQVPASLILAIIRQESAFNTFARSGADAFGLMQVLPTVHQQFQKKIQIPIDHHEDYFRPEVNLPYGVALLKELIRKFDGRIERVASAYNASENALKRWIKSRWNDDVIEFIEEVPFEETRTYIKLVIRNCAFYEQLLNLAPEPKFPNQCFRIKEN